MRGVVPGTIQRLAVPRRGRGSIASLLLLLALSLVAGPLAAPASLAQGLNSRIAEARQRQASIRRAIDRQQAILADLQQDEHVVETALGSTARSLDGINADQASVRKEIRRASNALAKVQARREALIAELRQLDWTLELVEQEIADGDAELDGRRRLLGARLAEADRSQQTTLLEQVLADDSFSDALLVANAHLAYGDEDVRLARAIAQDQRALDSLRTMALTTRHRTDVLRREQRAVAEQIAVQQKRLDKAKKRLERIERRTRSIQNRQRSVFQRIVGNKKQAAAEVARQAAAERRLENQIASLVAEAKRRAAARERARREAAARARREANQRPPSRGTIEGNGRFSWPVSGYVTQEYGCTGFYLEPPRGSCAHFHDGIDISGASGTPIRAAEDGVVAYSGWGLGSDPSFLVVIGHSGGYATTYAHLQGRQVVRSGQSVKKGQVIGYMGNTGNSTGSHLHWEVTRNGADINPRSVV